MQIHRAQCAKYRLFQEGYPVTPHMHSDDMSCLAWIFYFLFFFPKTAGHLLWRSLNETWASLVDGYRKRYFVLLLPLFIGEFSVNQPFLNMRTSHVLVKLHQQSLQSGFNMKSAIYQVRATPLTPSSMHQKWLSRSSSDGGRCILQSMDFRVWTAGLSLPTVNQEAASVPRGQKTEKGTSRIKRRIFCRDSVTYDVHTEQTGQKRNNKTMGQISSGTHLSQSGCSVFRSQAPSFTLYSYTSACGCQGEAHKISLRWLNTFNKLLIWVPRVYFHQPWD